PVPAGSTGPAPGPAPAPVPPRPVTATSMIARPAASRTSAAAPSPSATGSARSTPAPTLASTATPGAASWFITTSDHSPARGVHRDSLRRRRIDHRIARDQFGLRPERPVRHAQQALVRGAGEPVLDLVPGADAHEHRAPVRPGHAYPDLTERTALAQLRAAHQRHGRGLEPLYSGGVEPAAVARGGVDRKSVVEGRSGGR